MSNFFMLLYKWMAINSNGRSVLPVKKTATGYFATNKTKENHFPPGQWGDANDDLAIPQKPRRHSQML